MIKRLLILSAAIFTIGQVHAQTFMHGVGTGALVNTMNNSDPSIFGTLMYNPRFSLSESENSSVTIGLPLTFGVAGSYNYDAYYGTESSLQYMINAPLMVNYNIGAGSSKEAASRFGYFIGGGFGLNHGSYVLDEVFDPEMGYTQTVEKSLTTFGPAVNGGVRFAVGNGSHNIEILLSYMKGLNDYKPNTFGLQGVFNF
jgi:hypothetical protein